MADSLTFGLLSLNIESKLGIACWIMFKNAPFSGPLQMDPRAINAAYLFFQLSS
jgi:hypothetical protein